MSSSEKKNKKRTRQNNIVLKLARRPVEFCARHNITPNRISYIGFLSSLIAAFFLAIGTIHNIYFAWLAPVFIIISGILDVLDGSVARKNGLDSQSGAFLDSNLDRLSDAMIILGLIYGGLLNYFLGFILLFFSIMISYVRSKAENEGVQMKGIGIMERAERILFIWFGLILECWIYYLSGVLTGNHFTLFFPSIMIVYSFLLIVTVLQRFIFTFKSLGEVGKNKM